MLNIPQVLKRGIRWHAEGNVLTSKAASKIQ